MSCALTSALNRSAESAADDGGSGICKSAEVSVGKSAKAVGDAWCSCIADQIARAEHETFCEICIEGTLVILILQALDTVGQSCKIDNIVDVGHIDFSVCLILGIEIL